MSLTMEVSLSIGIITNNVAIGSVSDLKVAIQNGGRNGQGRSLKQEQA